MDCLPSEMKHQHKQIFLFHLFYCFHIFLQHFPFIYYFYIFLQFFDLPRHDAVKALNIYKRAGKQVLQYFWIRIMLHRDIVGSRWRLCCFYMNIPIKLNCSTFSPLYRLQILQIFMNSAKDWTSLGTFNFRH